MINLYDDNANEWSNDVDQHEFNDVAKESSFEDIYEFNKYFNLYKIFTSPLFQSKVVKESNAIKHVPPRYDFYFNDGDYCRTFICFLIHVMNLLCIMMTMFLI